MRIAVMMRALAGLFAGCATTSGDPRDPIEPVNRAVFQFNDTVDRAVFKPVAQGYRAALPSPVRTGVTNFFSNLRDPWNAINQILQGKVEEGATDFMRFVTNTSFGLLGIFDVASEGGMPKHDEDFGQTLGVWGLDTGAYLVLPILGPSSVRDGTGRAVDSFGYLPWQGPDMLDSTHEVRWRNGLTGLDFVQTRAGLLDASNVLEEAALDRYAFVRNAYFQRRRSQVHDGNPPPVRFDDDEETRPAAEPAPQRGAEPSRAAPVVPDDAGQAGAR
jgi:phospholipid-binding lipoprotein MlaA